MTYIKIAKKDDFIDTNYVSKVIFGKRVVVLKLSENKYHAVEAECKHQRANLLETCGKFIEGTIITCPRHQWKYDLLSGECLSNDSAPLRVFPVEIRDEAIFVGFNY